MLTDLKYLMILDLCGPCGNGFWLLDAVEQIAKEYPGRYNEVVVKQDMVSGNHKNLLDVFKKHCGFYFSQIIGE